MISEETKKRIQKEAEKFAFVVPYDGSNKFYNEGELKAYIAGAEAEAERSSGLVEAIVKANKDLKFLFDTGMTPPQVADAIVEIEIDLKKALNQYNSPVK